MVLWEITLGTAYFLGLRRTYRLALRIQRRVISPKHPKIRQFAHRRTRAVFDAAVSVHKNIQQRDIDLGRNLGNWILRWLDRMKPSANIRAPPEFKLPKNCASSSMSMTKQVNSSSLKNPGSIQVRNQESDRHMFSSMTNGLTKTLPSISMMMRARKTSGTMTQYRNLFTNRPEALRSDYTRGSFGGVIRKDIMQWVQQN
ncbi:uncharacterized protein LOC126796189 [Argentina anserina]|uniref:uncharacterized protein LOC126796189 n=1 Tax=Argentina anserina TaxID=57926 RepID=UPI0021762602|nr:uncharacterized protein LOC126796189 [Potentilla anserina]